MDLDDAIYLALFLFGLYRRFTNQSRTAKPRSGAKPKVAPRPPAPATVHTLQADTAKVAADLKGIDGRIAKLESELDPGLAAALTPLLRGELKDGAKRLREQLELPSDPSRQRARLRAANDLLSGYERAFHAIATIAARRQDPAYLALHRSADLLFEQVTAPALRQVGEAAARAPRPVVLLSDAAADAALEGFLVRLPIAVAAEPLLLTELTTRAAHHALATVPRVRDEISAGLELDASADANSGPERMARVLFGAWLGPLLDDLLAAQLIGPTYLRAQARLLRSPEAPGRATTVAVANNGVVQATPPAHIRVHAVARWLLLHGVAESEIASSLAQWQAIHQTPTTLRLTGGYSGSAIPLPPLMAVIDQILERLKALPLADLGGSRLGDLAGFDAVANLNHRVTAAGRRYEQSKAPKTDARVLLAAAIDAGLGHPDQGPAIHAWVLRSLSAVASVRASDPGPATTAIGHRIGAREAVEALLLGELMLTPRARTLSR